MPELSILIPSRNEMWLRRTIEDIVANRRADSEVIAVLDGAWAEPQIPDMPGVTLIHFTESIGQRAATNRAAQISTAKYIAKTDAHCAFDEGFDVKLMADMQDDWTVAPTMRNLHVFDWVCNSCGKRTYQGPTPEKCECGITTGFTRDVVWIAKTNPQSNSYCFDPEPHFQYFGEFNKRPEGQGDLTESMSLQGSFFMMTRERYLGLNMDDESFGSWGSQGLSIAIKSWLSGGKVMINHKTWYAHLFRGKGDFGFPYPIGGKQISHAKKRARDIFYRGKFPGQIYPLSWLIKKFWPIPYWKEEDLANIIMHELPFPNPGDNLVAVGNVISLPAEGVTDRATPGNTRNLGREKMPVGAVGLIGIDESNSTGRTAHVFGVGNESQVSGIATGGIVADMVENRNVPLPASIGEGFNQPGIDQSVNVGNVSHESDISIPQPVMSTGPNPTLAQGINGVDFDPGKDSVDGFSRQKDGFGEILTGSHSMPPIQVSSRLELDRADTRSNSFIITHPSKSIVYYTDNRLIPLIMSACQKQLTKVFSGGEIISVSLKPVDFGRNIVLPLERGYLTLFEQILAGLEASTADIVFFSEHDVLYAPGYLDFTPPDPNVIYYNLNIWQIRSTDGHLVYWDAKRTSQLCAYRKTLVEHYRKRVERVKRDGFSRRIGFEPGSHHRPERIDDLRSDIWVAKYPNLDIKHGQNLTQARWSTSEFRSQRNCRNWKEADELPFWGVTKDRFDAILEAVNV